MTRPAGAIGAPQQRAEDQRLLTGRGRFVADISLHRMVEAVFVRSTQAHARLVRVRTAAAAAAPGVWAVLAAADVPPVTLSNARHPALLLTPQPVLAVDRVRFVGEPLAVVVADDRYAAEDAAELVDVDYDPLPYVGGVDEARPAALLFDEVPGNAVFHEVVAFGAADAAFDAAAHVVSRRLRFPRQLACPLEPRGCIADYDAAAGTLTVWSSTQAPHRLRRDLAAAVRLPEHRVRVVMHDIGGAFGQKIPTHVEEVAVALAAMRLGRPVRWIEDRQENLVAAPHSRDQQLAVELALDESLAFTGLRARIVGDAGAYSFNSGSALTEAYRTARALPGPYRIANYAYEVTIGLTNKSPIAPYRGVGLVAAQTARELLIDDAARALSVDRVELRRRNLVSSGELPYTTCTGMVYDDVSFVETLDAACRVLDEGVASVAAQRDGGRDIRVGVGISPYVEPSGLGTEGGRQLHGFASPSHDSARVVLDPSGKATVTVGTPSVGQGLETTMAQVAAEVLGLPVEDVTVAWTDTSQAPISYTGARGSRSAVVSGGAVGLAATEVRDQVLRTAAELLEANPADLEICDGMVRVTGSPASAVPVREVVSAGFTRPELRSPDGPAGFAATRVYDPGASYSNACVVAVVSVDVETGKVGVERVVAVEDCGTMINPMIVDGQFVGAVAQAIGAVLHERVAYDPDGQPLTSTLMDYLLPTAADTVTVELSHLRTPSSATWRGIKGMGESGMIGTVAALTAAVADVVAAAGGCVEELPLLPGTVWQLLDGRTP